MKKKAVEKKKQIIATIQQKKSEQIGTSNRTVFSWRFVFLSFCSDLSNEDFVFLTGQQQNTWIISGVSRPLRCSGMAVVSRQNPLFLFLNWLEPRCWHGHCPQSSISKNQACVSPVWPEDKKVNWWVQNPSLATVNSLWCKLTATASVSVCLFVQYSENHVVQTSCRGSAMAKRVENIGLFVRSSSSEEWTDNSCSTSCPCNRVSSTHQEPRLREKTCCCVSLHQPRFRRPFCSSVSSVGNESDNNPASGVASENGTPADFSSRRLDCHCGTSAASCENCCFHLFKSGLNGTKGRKKEHLKVWSPV